MIGGTMIIIAALFHFAISCAPSDREVETQEDTDEKQIQEKNKLDV